MRYVFAGDRAISCEILKFLIGKNKKPLALYISENDKATHNEELIKISGLEDEFIFRGNDFKSEQSTKLLASLNVDYIIGIHFPYIVPDNILNMPKVGVLNLHPAFLPFNKGWHTPSWAILDNTPYGATLHFMAEALDEGDIIYQKRLEIDLSDTANTLYKKALKLEEEVFYEAYEDLLTLNPKRMKQFYKGTSHLKNDLVRMKAIDLNSNVNALEFINKLRALTTNNINEAATVTIDGKKMAIQIHFEELI
jgi:methionyl-tRNA formyltransferase